MRKLFFVVFVVVILVISGSQVNAEKQNQLVKDDESKLPSRNIQQSQQQQLPDLGFVDGIRIEDEGSRKRIIVEIRNSGLAPVGNINLFTYLRIEDMDGQMIWHNHRFFLYNWGESCPFHPGMSHYGFIPGDNEVKLSKSTAGNVCFEQRVVIRAWIDSDLESSGIIQESNENNNYIELRWYPPGYRPQRPKFLGNYPNPFNPKTKISYTVAKPGHVKLTVYNMLGQKVADLVDEIKSSGRYSVIFNAKNLTSGVYFYKIKTDGFMETKKMFFNK